MTCNKKGTSKEEKKEKHVEKLTNEELDKVSGGSECPVGGCDPSCDPCYPTCSPATCSPRSCNPQDDFDGRRTKVGGGSGPCKPGRCGPSA